jgi:hypothetical protein
MESRAALLWTKMILRVQGTHQPGGGRLARLAKQIDALVEKDAETIRRAQEIEALRSAAAGELHSLCSEFVRNVNALLQQSHLTLDPQEFHAEDFRDDRQTLFQISVSGRIIEIEFGSTSDLLSTEDFRVPYALSGSIRAFNQELLERNLTEEHLLFYTVERSGNLWRYFDAQTHRSAKVDAEYVMSILESLV